MKSQILLTISCLFISFFAMAQTSDKAAVSLGEQIIIPFKGYTAGVAVYAKIEIPLQPQLKLTFNSGYSIYIPQSRKYSINPTSCSCVIFEPMGPVNNPVFKFIPIQVGLRYYYANHLYLDAETGGAIGVNSVAHTGFLYGGGLGWLIVFNAHNSLDFGLHLANGFKTKDYDYYVGHMAFSLAYRHQF